MPPAPRRPTISYGPTRVPASTVAAQSSSTVSFRSLGVYHPPDESNVASIPGRRGHGGCGHYLLERAGRHRTAAFSPRPSQLGRSQGGGRVLPEAVRIVGNGDDPQRLRGGEDGQHLHPLQQGGGDATKRVDRSADVRLAFRLEHAELAPIQREVSRDGADDRADVGCRRRQARRHVERYAAGAADAGTDSRDAREGYATDA